MGRLGLCVAVWLQAKVRVCGIGWNTKPVCDAQRCCSGVQCYISAEPFYRLTRWEIRVGQLLVLLSFFSCCSAPKLAAFAFLTSKRKRLSRRSSLTRLARGISTGISHHHHSRRRRRRHLLYYVFGESVGWKTPDTIWGFLMPKSHSFETELQPPDFSFDV